jgi:hypothetical protein
MSLGGCARRWRAFVTSIGGDGEELEMGSALVDEPRHVGCDDPAVLTSFVDSPPAFGASETQELFG